MNRTAEAHRKRFSTRKPGHSGYEQALVGFTERILTWRKRRVLRSKAKSRRKHPVVDWLQAFLVAAFWVLLINQYALQAYTVPTTSMEHTIDVDDRFFVNKLVYGPEILPGVGKLPGIRPPDRDDIIVFENPRYLSRGPVFDIAHRVIFMLTFSLVDIDRDENGDPRSHFLIKRAAGVGGDGVRTDMANGEVLVRPQGTSEWYVQKDLARDRGNLYQVQREFTLADDEAIRRLAELSVAREAGLPVDVSDLSEAAALPTLAMYGETFAYWTARYRSAIRPHHLGTARELQRLELGQYVPDGYLLPMGDNRDNSADGRSFGIVPSSEMLGKTMFRFWPPRRVGRIP